MAEEHESGDHAQEPGLCEEPHPAGHQQADDDRRGHGCTLDDSGRWVRAAKRSRAAVSIPRTMSMTPMSNSSAEPTPTASSPGSLNGASTASPLALASSPVPRETRIPLPDRTSTRLNSSP